MASRPPNHPHRPRSPLLPGFLNLSRSFQPVSFDESIGIREGADGGEVFHSLEPQHAVTLEPGTRGVSWSW